MRTHLFALADCPRSASRSSAHSAGARTCAGSITVIPSSAVRFKFDKAKSRRLRAKRGLGFEEAQELFYMPYYLDQISGEPEQWVAIGWVRARLYTVVFEERVDDEGDFYHLVTLWKSTNAERKLYEENQ